jgi:YD repeat-containing protein
MGNRIRTFENGVTTAYTTNNLNQYTKVGDTTYTFDADGNLVSETSPSGTHALYSYDDENRLIAVQQGADAWALHLRRVQSSSGFKSQWNSVSANVRSRRVWKHDW